MNDMPDRFECDGESHTWEEWSMKYGHTVQAMKTRWTTNDRGRTNHTPRQIVGKEQTRWAGIRRRAKPGKVTLPEDADALIEGSFYKIGIHGFVFMLVDGDWRRSNRTAGEVRAAM
jgi:hypothetical protein